MCIAPPFGLDNMDGKAMLARAIEAASASWATRELEVRVGRPSPDGLHISSAELEALDAQLRASRHFESSRWDESHTYHYAVDGVAMRTETCYCSETLQIRAQTICKTRLQVHDMSIDAQTSLAARVSLSEEGPVLSPPEVVLPTFVRIR